MKVFGKLRQRFQEKRAARRQRYVEKEAAKTKYAGEAHSEDWRSTAGRQ